MTTRPIILLDCDGVIADFSGAFLDEVFHVTGARHTHDEIREWNLEQCAFFEALERKHPGLKDKVWRRINVPGWAHEIKPLEHAEAMVELARRFGDLYIVTSPLQSSDSWARDRERWLAKHFAIDSRKVIHCAAKELVFGHVFVDDKPEHVLRWRDRWQYTGDAYLWDAPYNRSVHGGFRRLAGIDTFHDAIHAAVDRYRNAIERVF